ncbi:SH3 domain-containing protein [Roseburia inulinivorans]
MKHKSITLMAVAMSIVLSLSACGTAAQTDSTKSTESAVTESTESVENSTEAFVPEEELSTEESVDTTEATESVAETVTETQEPVADEAVINVKTVSEDKTANAGYTYSDLSKTMYAKSTVNVRSLPSTSGNKLGSLSKNQEVAVTGQCNETGWYRISYNNTDGFVSNKYLADEPVAKATNVAQAQTQSDETVVGSNPSGKVDPNDPSTWAPPHENMYYDANLGQWVDWDRPADGYNRAIAEQVWAYVNEERAAAGLNTLAWDENIYNFACTRAQQIVTDFSHNGNTSYYGENCLINAVGTAESIHNQVKGSYKHHDNYMNSMYGSGACAIYVYNGVCYGVETFAMASSPQTDSADPYAGNQNREVNGTTVDLSGAQAEAFDNGNYWTASNGIVVYVESNGNLSCNATGDAATAALLEYIDTH